MARRQFGGTAADFYTDAHGNVRSGGVGTVWTARVDGTQITDLLDADGNPCRVVTAAVKPKGQVLFYGPDDGTSEVWIDFGGGRTRMAAAGSGDSAAPGAVDPEGVRDTVAAALVAGSGIAIAVDDTADTITVSNTSVQKAWGDPWVDLGTLGVTEIVNGLDGTMRRRKGTLNQNCTITITLADNQVLDLMLVQDATGGRTTTWVGVDEWSTATGLAPTLSSRPAGATDRLRFERVLGRVYGHWITEPFTVPSYTVTSLPSAIRAGRVIYVSNEVGGAVLAFSDGTNWRRVTDRAVVS